MTNLPGPKPMDFDRSSLYQSSCCLTSQHKSIEWTEQSWQDAVYSVASALMVSSSKQKELAGTLVSMTILRLLLSRNEAECLGHVACLQIDSFSCVPVWPLLPIFVGFSMWIPSWYQPMKVLVLSTDCLRAQEPWEHLVIAMRTMSVGFINFNGTYSCRKPTGYSYRCRDGLRK